jgi:hypothetical protein
LVWVVGLVVGGVVVRLVACWPVSWDVGVVAVDMKCFLFCRFDGCSRSL